MTQIERQGHKGFGFIAGVAEHQPLVSRALLFLAFADHTTVDVGALSVHGVENATGFSVKLVVALVVAYSADHLPGNVLNIDIGLGVIFTGNYDLPGGHKYLAGHLCIRVLRNMSVNDGIRYLVRHLVGMSFRHAFRCK